MAQKKLFEVVSRQNVSFKNAIVMAPMTRSRALNGVPNDLMAAYYAQRASAGLLVTEGTAPSANGLGYARTPGIFSEEQIEGWKKVVDSVHAKGSKIFLQLMHVGRVAHSANMPAGSRILAPSAIRAEGDMWTDSAGMQKKEIPHAMTLNDIHDTVRDFANAATNAVNAGFDGVELHGANGYLLEQFLNPVTNTRTDQYGGQVENRIRFLLEVTAAVIGAIGKQKVGMRISPYNRFNDMALYPSVADTYSALVRKLSELDILYIHFIDYAARAAEEGNELMRDVRSSFKNLLILNGGYNAERAEAALSNEGADMISFGTPFIANPDLAHRLKQGLPLSQPNTETFYTAGAEGYTDYAAMAEEQVS